MSDDEPVDPRHPADALADHLRDCLGAKAAVVFDGSADATVAAMLAAGWTLGATDYRYGKRIRMMTPPPSVDTTGGQQP